MINQTAFFVLLVFASANTVFAESQISSTSDNSLDVKIKLDDSYQPGEETRLKIEFLTPDTEKIQVHIDYTVDIKNNDNLIFGPIPLTHTSTGSVSIPVFFEKGINEITVSVEGILFVPVPSETATFDISFGESTVDSSNIPVWVKGNAEWWANDLIDDETFVSGIQFLIQEEIISVSAVSSEAKSDDIPKWIKSNADWWSQGLITDNDFLKGIEFLVENGIISVFGDPLSIGGVDLSQASPIFGSVDSPVTIIEFGDYQCPNCQKWFLNTKPDIVTNYIDTGKANLYFVDLAFLGDDSLTAAAATYCAGEQERYWDYHSYLYSNQRGIDGGWADASSLQDYAEILELDTDSFADCMDSKKYEKSIVFNLEESINNEIKTTPSFIIVGDDGQETIKGPQPFPVFEKIIESFLTS
jgi:protein-disulfide isomerase